MVIVLRLLLLLLMTMMVIVLSLLLLLLMTRLLLTNSFVIIDWSRSRLFVIISSNSGIIIVFFRTLVEVFFKFVDVITFFVFTSRSPSTIIAVNIVAIAVTFLLFLLPHCIVVVFFVFFKVIWHDEARKLIPIFGAIGRCLIFTAKTLSVFFFFVANKYILTVLLYSRFGYYFNGALCLVFFSSGVCLNYSVITFRNLLPFISNNEIIIIV